MFTVAALFSGLTYLLAPAKVKIKEVEKIVEVEGEKETIYKERIKVIIKRPDGTVEEWEEERDLSKKESEKSKSKETLKEKTVERKRLNWSVTGGIMIQDESILQNEFYMTVERRILGNFHVGGLATTNGFYGVGIGFKF